MPDKMLIQHLFQLILQIENQNWIDNSHTKISYRVVKKILPLIKEYKS